MEHWRRTRMFYNQIIELIQHPPVGTTIQLNWVLTSTQMQVPIKFKNTFSKKCTRLRVGTDLARSTDRTRISRFFPHYEFFGFWSWFCSHLNFLWKYLYPNSTLMDRESRGTGRKGTFISPSHLVRSYESKIAQTIGCHTKIIGFERWKSTKIL